MELMLGSLSQEVPILTMKQALLRLEDFDCFIIDEADECLIDQGSIIDPVKEKFIGFWDMLKVKTVLLTATPGHDFQKVLDGVF